ncbi:hypothetical protein BDV29DRAFT_194328 [Aspergillus leporis]|uniref:ER-bound oxygenase mpaB/mpaB'/Rubber oxygenase catalytic domain-containing protein n=1 Tax=Aspergillus leporis TaxID=41062 RepID=A0A5N5WNJ7_9EURO|nr:hypothetical protein BDV29DRAFT_194328 [Aspergillus leporis]
MGEITSQAPGADKPYKWIRQEIEASDPYKDYVKIWRLSIEYTGVGDFTQNLIYAITFANFVGSEWGSNAIWRDDGGKVLHHAVNRKSVDVINKLHAHYAKSYPGHFSHTIDFLYVLCYTAISVHRLRTRLRLSGFTEKQKIAAHLFWKEMCRLFLVEVHGKPLEEWKPLIDFPGFPEDWDGMYNFCEDVENNYMVATVQGHLIAEALFDQFAFRFFPPLLRHLGRALPITLSLPQTLKTHRIEEIHTVLAFIIVWSIGTFIWIIETFFPDPKISYQESLQLRSPDEKKKLRVQSIEMDMAFPQFFVLNHQDEAALYCRKSSLC